MSQGPESKIQTHVVDYAKTAYHKKVKAKKNQAGKFGTNGDPDYTFFWINEHTEFIEFKGPDGELTDLQIERHAEIRALGFLVHVVSDKRIGRSVIDDMYKRACAKKARRAA